MGGGGQKAVRRAPGSTQGELLEGIGESRARQGGSRPGAGSHSKSFGTGPHFGRNYPDKTLFFDDSSAKWTSWGLGKLFVFAQAGPRSISKSAIIDKKGSNISEDLIYFCDSGSPFSEKTCWICCKGCQILTSRNSLAAATGSSRQPAEVPGASAARDLPSTRAGGQDDVSSQANSLK